MFKRNVVSLAVLTTLVATSAVAANKKDDQKDSVNSWGPWNGVQTAAGPGAGAAVPLLIQFANSQNNIDSSAFDAGVENDNAGYREYMAWYSRNKHGDRKYARGNFESINLADGVEGSKTLDFVVGTESGEQTYSPRELNGYDYGYHADFHDTKKINKKKTNHQYYHVYAALNGFLGMPMMKRGEELSEEDIAFLQGYWGGYDELRNNKGKYKGTRWNNQGAFIAGQTSTLASVQNALAGNVSANYSGWMGLNGGRVDITLNLGAAPTWSGTFDGRFGNDHAHGPAFNGNNGQTVQFQVNNGAINGVDLSGVVDSNGVIGGVNASFFGDQAQHINGIVDVEHDKLGDLVDVFQTSNQSGMHGPI